MKNEDDLSFKAIVLICLILVFIPIVLTAYAAMEWSVCSSVWKGLVK